MLITSVEKNKKNGDRLSIFIDGKFSFSISEEDYIRLNLYEKQEISEEEIDQIKENINNRSARWTAVKFLALKLRPEKAVRVKLEEEGFDGDTIENVIEELKAMGYVNDSLYARRYVLDRNKLNPRSKRLLKLELLSRGIPAELADTAVGESETDDDSAAESIARKKFGKSDLTDERIIKKAVSFLYNRGFSFETIEGVINRIKQDV